MKSSWPQPGTRYSDEEIVLIRQQIKRGNQDARAAAKAAGVKMHPRIAALRAANQPTTDTVKET